MWIYGEPDYEGEVEVSVNDIMTKASEGELTDLFWKIHARYEDSLNITLRELFEEVLL